MNRTLLTLFTLILTTTLTAADNQCSCTPQSISKVFTAVAKEASPAVVYIRADGVGEEDEMESGMSGQSQDPFGDEFFNRFFGVPGRKTPKQPPASQGSGFLVSDDGYILTNAHVVRDASKITITLHDGRQMPASLIGIDSSTDLGVIKVDGKGFDSVKLGNSDELEVGEFVIAIGSPFQLRTTVTVGVVSAKGRQNLSITDFDDFIQTDAAINPGNSGGPLLNLSSEVIGINTAIVSRTGGGHLGIGFAIPSNMVKPIMNQIIKNGSVIRGYLGVALQPLDQDMADAFNLERPEGALVAEVVKGGPAEKAGLRQGDIIIQYDKTPVKSIGSFRNEISLMEPGTKITLKVNRNGKILTLKVVLGSHSDKSDGSGYSKKLGIEVEALSADLAKKLGYTPGEEGVVITKIKPGSPTAVAGMRPGFLILAINHKKVTNVEEFNKALEETKKNRVLILAKQGNVTKFYSLKLD